MINQGEREQRYDRQLRLWGDHGQFAIENAKVCLIRSGAMGAEILKNLVLPGIGSFTIVDNSIVRDEDLGCNFFLSEHDLHKPKAKAVTEYLLELNEAVNGNYVVEDFADLIENDPQFFLGFSIIIVTDAREWLLIRLSRILQASSIPLVICFSVGVIGYLRVSAIEHVIIESHPDSTRPDVRLDMPPAGLVEMANEIVLETMPAEQLSRVPWLIVVHLFVQKFIEKYGHFPQNHKEKLDLRQMIHRAGVDLTSRLREREPNLESSFVLENFQEACRAVNTAVCPTEIPTDVRDLLDDDRCTNAAIMFPSTNGATHALPKPFSTIQPMSHRQPGCQTTIHCAIPSTTTFWRLVCALKDFVQHEGEGQLPIRGSLPDMTSDSKRYLRLLSIYRERSEWAVERLSSRLTQFPDITLQDIRLFVKNAAFLRVVRCRSFEEEMKLSPARSEDLALIPTHEDNDAMLWYLVLRGACSFLSETGRWPGSAVPYTTPFKPSRSPLSPSYVQPEMEDGNGSQGSTDETHVIETDLPAFHSHLRRVLRAFGIAPSRVSLDYVNELCRFGGGELHSVVAFMGGVVAQEVIKLITHQFVPITKPLIYNAITQRTELVDF
ncbi:Amyloid beta protein binding protein 1 [Paragonimus heterotremus]|uniref:NEDD8-activating enzyme E1 regulatory subunit n=1 Tax=Paragonimus heterotremus TaxID=100268 RepID=A0A8J4SM39_9TREM|nr:Amyloid beta protein binding protein 1 [Paragonimus heterotremus]